MMTYCAGCGKRKRLRYGGLFCTMRCAAKSALHQAAAGNGDAFCGTCGEIGCGGLCTVCTVR